ncbi:DnaB-like helicase C-terminal domain-containing protein [Undibacterium sp. RTI2.1]|uniref:DnaB-like helicase C-terminal domain-containing protein n=1 Tax=unclassified Undibacterium TaxID=2630295 RepID=UPI002AB55913|nr:MULTISPECIES: DnaB-like helicase C-terminal domain-containing protein [unclassified Undibacterium]MDY7537635.1 DnaB-like helicase C-terminal domain-containing protein [Undibacterium sp. 5I1]MEB0029236.1 DnaB-like helicase C-terminal domain-containing protein [Undibacterium sp. RTI2.1]MEB0115544.1 DnaB-like helicase C-terminal domain-containing protein [Undibacterium sp. RTI2.2]MEB0230180.1 DnaB-like helicase C-terminal domain-containing protein [Undibacterium sp. 10I3]MEB0256372.1 DnaB-like
MTTDVLEVAEQAVSDMIAGSFTGVSPTASAPSVTLEADKYEFDADFQLKVATHTLRDLNFMRKAGHLIKPEYFEDVGVQAMVNMALRFYQKWGTVPQTAIAGKQLLSEDLTAKVIRADVKPLALSAFKSVFGASADLSNGDWVAAQVAEFARHQAVSQAIYQSVNLLEKKSFTKIEQLIKMATEVGVNVDSNEYDYFEKIEERTRKRIDKAAGILPPSGITTGQNMIDNLLYHRGWGRKELSIILGGAKSGKTTALINFAKAAALSGFNVLYATLEVASEILSERLDATITDIAIKDLGLKMHEVRSKVEAAVARSGKFKVHEYPSGTFTPNQLRQLIERYKSPALMPDGSTRDPIKFDLVVVDYADIMAPNFRSTDTIENSKNVYLDLRAIAFDENVAMLSATQGNREGAKATVLNATHVADDYNKVRTVDIMISINMTEEERANGEARLHFAASRNQEGGITIFIKQELAKMKFIASILRIE